MAMSLQQLVDGLDVEIRGNGHLTIEGAQPLDKAGPHDIAFVVDRANRRKLAHTTAGAVIINRSVYETLEEACDATFVIAEDSYASFFRVLERLRPTRPRAEIGVSPQSIVSPSARIGNNTNVHPGAFVGDDAVIGDSCDIMPGAVVGAACTLGNEVTVHASAVLYPGITIGNRVIIHASAVIGADGFGYRTINGKHERLPHYGTVLIADDVEIGAGTTIDRAMIGATVIGEGSKLDNLVMVAHNCELGRHNLLVSQVGLAGSVTTGEYVVCAGQVGVADHVHLGDGCVLGSMAGVHKDLPGGQRYFGAPAMPESEAKRILMGQKRIPETWKRVRQLEARVAELEARFCKLEGDGESSHREAA